MAIEESDELLMMFKALADESRLKIIGLLATRERSVDELATTLKLKPPTVSHHLATLRESGLVRMRAAGTTHVYHFQPEALRELNRRLAPEKLAIPDDEEGDEWEQKVLADFTEQGRLKAVPAGERKRLGLGKKSARAAVGISRDVRGEAHARGHHDLRPRDRPLFAGAPGTRRRAFAR